MRTLRNFVCVVGCVLVGLITIITLQLPPMPPPTAVQIAAKEKRDACVKEQAGLITMLVDKPWQTGDIVYHARKLCDSKGIFEPR